MFIPSQIICGSSHFQNDETGKTDCDPNILDTLYFLPILCLLYVVCVTVHIAFICIVNYYLTTSDMTLFFILILEVKMAHHLKFQMKYFIVNVFKCGKGC